MPVTAPAASRGSTEVGYSFDAARDAAQQIVTARLHHSDDVAAEIATDFIDQYPQGGLALSLTLVDLLLYLHRRWAAVVNNDEPVAESVLTGAWAALLADIEDARSRP